MVSRSKWSTETVKDLVKSGEDLPNEFGVCLSDLDMEDRRALDKLERGRLNSTVRFHAYGKHYMAGYSLPRTPLAGGEFVQLDGSSHEGQVWELRSEFLSSVDRMVPSVGLELGQYVWPRVLRRDRSRSKYPSLDFLKSRDFLGGLEEWAKKSGLFVDWFYDPLLEKLEVYLLVLDGAVGAVAESGNDRPKKSENIPLSLAIFGDIQRRQTLTCPERVVDSDASFEFSGDWNPLVERRVEAANRLFAQFQTVIEHRMDEIERRFSIQGYERQAEPGVVVGSRRSVQKIQLHCDWLALFQCGGLSYSDIADRYPAEKDSGYPDAIRQINRPNTIQKAVRSLAEQIDLPLRD